MSARRPRFPRERRNAGTRRLGQPRRLAPLPRSFFARSTLAVAKDLLGHFLVHETPHGVLIGRLVEVEAYHGPTDPASHAYRMTPRSLIMWGPPGTAYVYFTYGNHYCMNVVTEPDGTAGAVLFRAVEPVAGVDIMRTRRHVGEDRLLTSGPGRLTQAMGIGRSHNGADLTRPPLYLARGRGGPVPVRTSPRIGVRVATNRWWRFYIPTSRYVSR
jgi:DNA-3-methyladenine glycosylase